jgi:hypothetical protein
LGEIFSHLWGWGPSGLVLKEWAIIFDPARESFSHAKVWAILPNLPLVFWQEEVLIAIWNSITTYLDCEPN